MVHNSNEFFDVLFSLNISISFSPIASRQYRSHSLLQDTHSVHKQKQTYKILTELQCAKRGSRRALPR